MELKRAEIKNFMGIGDGMVDFNRPSGITLIKGVNNDSPTSISNGAGKSSVFEAIFWALFGKTKRGLTGDAVVNREAGKDCVVRLLFDDHLIERRRKPTDLKFWQIDTAANAMTDLTKGTIKETQELIESTIKFNELTFSKMVYFGQEDVKAFASLTDAELKKVFEQSLGITFVSEHHEKAKAYRDKLKQELVAAEANAATFEGQIKVAEEKIVILQKAAKDLSARRETEKLRILADIAADNEKVEQIKQQYIKASAEAKTAEASVVELQKKLNELDGYHKQLSTKYLEQHGSYEGAASLAQQAKIEMADLRHKADMAPNAVGQACETCRRPFTENDINNLIAGLEDAIAKRHEDYKRRAEEANVYKAQADQISALLGKLETAVGAQRNKVTAKVAEADPANKALTLNDLKTRGNDTLQRINENQQVLIKLDAEDATYSKEIAEQQSWRDDRTMELAMAKRQADELKGEYEVAEMLVEVLSNGGMKSYIFDNVTPELNKEINRYAAILDDIEVEVSTVTRLKNGEFREKFHINVDNKNGAGEFDGNSGGEKQKVNLAVALGFNRVFRNMFSGAVNAVLLDEPFESLDKGSSEAVIRVCKEFESVGNVFVITHQDAIKDLITDVITVEKNGKRATIS